jgi:hypothetical protein
MGGSIAPEVEIDGDREPPRIQFQRIEAVHIVLRAPWKKLRSPQSISR